MSHTVHLIHGFNEHHGPGKPKIRILESFLSRRQHRVLTHDYGDWDLVATRNNKNLARLILPHIEKGDSVIAFSNGAAITAHLCMLGAELDRIVLIQPALSKKWIAPLGVKEITVFWNEGDNATVGGKWYRRVTGLLPWRWQERHKWGEMGHTGFTGNDERYLQFDTEHSHRLDLPVVSGHSAWAKPEYHEWHEFITSFA